MQCLYSAQAEWEGFKCPDIHFFQYFRQEWKQLLAQPSLL